MISVGRGTPDDDKPPAKSHMSATGMLDELVVYNDIIIL
jgi:hypothetical protein